MSTPFPTPKPAHLQTYGERYRNQHNLTPEQCTDHLLGHSLHAPLRWIWPLARRFCRYHLQEERLSIQVIAQQRTPRSLNAELIGLSHHPANRSLCRRLLRIRVSSRRVRKILLSLPDTPPPPTADTD